ncbi:MAG: response regulator [Alphaproteobacteria bacterium]|nr:response regulator [Alphaproteobacteria bacterium]
MPYKLDDINVLIVDDMKPMLDLTKAILVAFGFKKIHLAENGDDALRFAYRESLDLIITDHIMNPMDGLELTEKIRNDPKVQNPYVPIIMMTGFSAKYRVEKARDMGITEFLVKPFTAKDLYARIQHTIEKPRQFVKTKHFFGPDRRRKIKEDYEGPRRREVDTDETDNAPSTYAKDILKKLQDEAKRI